MLRSDAGALDARISLDAHDLARLRRRRHVRASAVAPKLETVIGAANAILLVAAEKQRGSAMRAELVDQSDLALRVAEREELLAENPDTHLRAIRPRDFPGEQDRHPVAPHEIAHAGARAGADERFRHVLVHGTTLLALSIA